MGKDAQTEGHLYFKERKSWCEEFTGAEWDMSNFGSDGV
jgi:hypothetical protein